jgi:flagellar motor switch protein FliG
MSEATISGERELSGPEKAAALLLMMGKPPAARVLKQFDQPDLRAVALAAAGLGAIPATTLDQLVDEFVTDFSTGADLLGDAGQAKSLLSDALPPDEIADILGLAPVGSGQPDVWRSLGQAPESAIIALLTAERAATATYILSRLDPAVATRLVAALPRDRRNAALCGLVAPLEVTPLAARLIEEAMEAALKQAPTAAADAGGRSRLAGIINNLDPEEAEDAMRALEQVRPKDAAIVKTMLFSFSDLPRLSERAPRSCSTGPRSTSSSWPCEGPTPTSATQFSRQCPRAGAVWSRANLIPAPSRPRRTSPRRARPSPRSCLAWRAATRSSLAALRPPTRRELKDESLPSPLLGRR